MVVELSQQAVVTLDYARRVGYEAAIPEVSLPALLDEIVRICDIPPVIDEFICAVTW